MIRQFCLVVVAMWCIPVAAFAAPYGDDAAGLADDSAVEDRDIPDNSWRTLFFEGKEAYQKGQIDEAIVKLRKAAESAQWDDTELHQTFAEALQQKLDKERKHFDPRLYNECVSQWLFVLRGESNVHKGVTLKGLGTKVTGTVGLGSEDETQILARLSLAKLTGRVPKQWETDTAYLKKVLRPESTVHAQIRPSDEKQDKQDNAEK